MEQKDLMLRLMKYKRVLLQFKSLGLDRVYSNNLGDALEISAALVRKDFSHFKIEGNRRGGYSINRVLEKLNHLLGDSGLQEIVIVGCGNLGKALLNHDYIRKASALRRDSTSTPPRRSSTISPSIPLKFSSPMCWSITSPWASSPCPHRRPCRPRRS